MAATYKLSYSTPIGVKLIESLSVSTFDLVRRINEVGALNVALADPAKYPIGYFVEDGIIDVWRSINSGPFYLETETSWLVNRVRYATDDNGRDILELQAADALCIAPRRIIAYDAGSTYTSKLEIADDLMKDVMHENFGASAIDTARDISSRLAIAGDLSQGAIVGDDIAWKKMFDVLRAFADASMAAGTRVIFDVIRTGAATFEFRTYKSYRGIDHSRDSGQAVIISQSFRNLGSPELVFDYTEHYNYVYAAGKGDKEWRPTAEASDSASIGAGPFARREFFINASNTTDPDILQSVADAALQAGKARVLFNGRVLDTPKCTYGIHYKYGDLVTAQYKGYVIDCTIDAVHISFDRDNGEQLEVRLKGESYV